MQSAFASSAPGAEVSPVPGAWLFVKTIPLIEPSQLCSKRGYDLHSLQFHDPGDSSLEAYFPTDLRLDLRCFSGKSFDSCYNLLLQLMLELLGSARYVKLDSCQRTLHVSGEVNLQGILCMSVTKFQVPDLVLNVFLCVLHNLLITKASSLELELSFLFTSRSERYGGGVRVPRFGFFFKAVHSATEGIFLATFWDVLVVCVSLLFAI